MGKRLKPGEIIARLRSVEFVRGLLRPYSLYNFCYPEQNTIKIVCEIFEEVGGLGKPGGVVPLPLFQTAALPLEVLNAAGFKNPINRKRILKLVRSTNIEPRFLIDAGYEYETDMAEGLHRWSNTSGGEFD